MATLDGAGVIMGPKQIRLGIVMLGLGGRRRTGSRRMECGDLEKIRFKSPPVFPSQGGSEGETLSGQPNKRNRSQAILAAGIKKKGTRYEND